MKKILLLTTCLLIAIMTMAQTQQGYVKTLGRPNKPGKPLPDVTIRMRGVVNAVLSGQDGRFSVAMPAEGYGGK